MPITTHSSGAVTVVRLERRWTPDEFGDALRTLIENGHKRVLIDCVGMGYLDSAENDELVKAYTLARAHGATIKLMLPKGLWGGLLGKTKLIVLFEMYDDEAEAIASFGGDTA